jgi:hypothetical protein
MTDLAETRTLAKGGKEMERDMETGAAEMDGSATSQAMDAAAGPAATASPEKDGWVRARLAAGWRFTRHLLEMVVAMMLGMGIFGLTLAAFGEPPGYANLLVEYGLMGAFMAAPMVAWMRFRGHPWRDGGEMTAAMVVPMLAPVALVQVGVLTEGSLMVISHVAMIGGMVVLMAYRFDRYAHADHGRRAR